MEAQPVSRRLPGAPRALPAELDLRPRGVGFVMRGWDFTRAEVAEAIRHHRMLNPAMELGTNICPWNCSFCFTESPDSGPGHKRRLAGELPLGERLALIDQAADLGARSINFVGAGEPTIDPDFWALMGRMRARGIVPIVYTEASQRLTDRAFVRRLFDAGATVVVKMNSRADPAYQDAIVRGAGPKASRGADGYAARRDAAVTLLLEEGFASGEPTRLAFDTIICRQNLAEIPELHRFARRHNIFVLFVSYLPSGRSSDALHDAIGRDEQRAVFEELARIDAREHGLVHGAGFPYAGGVPCTIRGLGLFVKITGAVLDCPGEMVALGDLRDASLAALWQRARRITEGFDGACAPRQAAWQERPVRRLAVVA